MLKKDDFSYDKRTVDAVYNLWWKLNKTVLRKYTKICLYLNREVLNTSNVLKKSTNTSLKLGEAKINLKIQKSIFCGRKVQTFQNKDFPM